ncbi:MAG: alpha/beta fold hydrolase, partial [Candidatus Sulfotelmatobacter sp.]
PTLPRFSPFVPLKAGSANPPILIAHGLGGRADFSKLAQYIQTGHPIFGIQAKGVDGIEKPFDRIEDMAEYYLNALTDVQSHGPYVLVGYSFGGLVALDMAQRLSKNGENVALLVLVDTYPHPRFLSKPQRVSLIARRTLRHIHEMKKMPMRDAATYFFHGLEHRLQMVGVRRHGQSLRAGSPLSLARTTERVKQSAYVALGCYRPQFYRGKIKFVSAESNSYFPDVPAAVWGKLADVVEVETVPGGHLDMVTAHFESLAAALTRYMNDMSLGK